MKRIIVFLVILVALFSLINPGSRLQSGASAEDKGAQARKGIEATHAISSHLANRLRKRTNPSCKMDLKYSV